MAASDAAEEEEEEEIVSAGPLRIAGWEDMTQIPADLGLPPIVAVQYDADDGAVLDLFAAVVESGEISERVYNLTAQVSTHAKPAFAASASLSLYRAPLIPEPMTVAGNSSGLHIALHLQHVSPAGDRHQFRQLHCLGDAMALPGRSARPVYAEGGSLPR